MWRFVKTALLLLVVAFLARHVARSWDTLVWPRSFHVFWLTGSVLVGISALLLFALQNRLLMRGHGCRVDASQAIALTYVPMVGKYVPGKICSVVLGFHVYDRMTIPKHIAASCMGLSMLLGVCSGLCVATLMRLDGNRVAFALMGAKAADRRILLSERSAGKSEFNAPSPVPFSDVTPPYFIASNMVRAYFGWPNGIDFSVRGRQGEVAFGAPRRLVEKEVTGPIDGPIWVAHKEDVVFYCSPGPGQKLGSARRLWMLRY